jgi:DNA polymerase elongation subunit (family B)
MVGYFGKNTNDVFTPLFCYVVAVGRALINQKAEELQKLGGTLLYINTDGVILNFKEPLIYNQKNSKILGDFGIEESGDEC